MTIATAIALVIPASIQAAQPALLEGEKPWAASIRNPENQNLLRIAKCETGYMEGGRPNWRHHNSVYTGALGFAHSTWFWVRKYIKPLPPMYAAEASVSQQLAGGRFLIHYFGGYSSWPACSVRLGLR